ncbi:hypothetical protein [Kitasatospora sp. NPDC098663]
MKEATYPPNRVAKGEEQLPEPGSTPSALAGEVLGVNSIRGNPS